MIAEYTSTSRKAWQKYLKGKILRDNEILTGRVDSTMNGDITLHRTIVEVATTWYSRIALKVVITDHDRTDMRAAGGLITDDLMAEEIIETIESEDGTLVVRDRRRDVFGGVNQSIQSKKKYIIRAIHSCHTFTYNSIVRLVLESHFCAEAIRGEPSHTSLSMCYLPAKSEAAECRLGFKLDAI